jgi:5S rRNA maturation endonuclease (ribonuclease M5)
MPAIALRIRKVKSGAIAATQIHNQRLVGDTEFNLRRIDSTRTHLNINKYYHQSNDIEAVADKLIKQKVKRKVRDNAIKLVEMVLQPGVGWYDIEGNTPQKFFDHTERVLKERFGQNLLSINMHLDENGGAHCHIMIVPITEDGRLSAKELFGNNKTDKKYLDWQDWAGDAYKPLGLDRGEKYSTAKHTSIKTYNKRVNSAVEEAHQIYNTGITKEEAIKQLAVVKEENKALNEENKQLKKTSSYYKQKAFEQNAVILKQQTENLKSISVREVIQYMYAGVQDKIDKNKYKIEGVGNVSVNDRENTFKVWGSTEKGSNNAINLVMQLSKVSFKQAVAKLAQFFTGESLVEAIVKSETIKQLAQKEVEKVLTTEELQTTTPTDQVIEHLRKTRGLDRPAINFLLKNGLESFKSGKFTNIVYFSADKKSAEITGTVKINNKRFKQNRGTDAVIINANAEQAVVAESVLDAISFCLVNGIDYTQTALISTSGNSKTAQALKALSSYSKVLIATDNDDVGNNIANKITAAHSNTERFVSVGKDWNEDLTNPEIGKKRESFQSIFKKKVDNPNNFVTVTDNHKIEAEKLK